AGMSRTTYRAHFAVARYIHDGGLDSAFGGDGIVTTSIGTVPDWGQAVAVRPHRRLVMAGHTALEDFTIAFALAQYTAAGDLDPAFGTSGTVLFDPSVGTDLASDVLLQADGGAVVAGSVNGKLALVRFTAAGTPDTTFGASAVAYGPQGGATAVVDQPDG